MYNNHIVMGDFNLHLSKEDNTNATIFQDLIEASGLYQHVPFHTHLNGNLLDLVISDIGSKVNIMTTAPGPFVLDYRAIITTLNIKREQAKVETRKVRKLHKVTSQQWMDEFKQGNIELTSNLEDLVQSFDKELTRTLDSLAPEKDTKLLLKPKCPWYCHELKVQKAKVRWHENKWLKHKLDSLWVAYKKECNRYYAMLKSKKTECYRNKVDECKHDAKKLHQLVNNLTSKPDEQLWLDHTSDEELANDFTKYFKSKILTIREI